MEKTSTMFSTLFTIKKFEKSLYFFDYALKVPLRRSFCFKGPRKA